MEQAATGSQSKSAKASATGRPISCSTSARTASGSAAATCSWRRAARRPGESQRREQAPREDHRRGEQVDRPSAARNCRQAGFAGPPGQILVHLLTSRSGRGARAGALADRQGVLPALPLVAIPGRPASRKRPVGSARDLDGFWSSLAADVTARAPTAAHNTPITTSIASTVSVRLQPDPEVPVPNMAPVPKMRWRSRKPRVSWQDSTKSAGDTGIEPATFSV